MSSGNFKMALSSLRRSRGRSLLTMFGIIVGVVAVTVTISVGSGVKRQLTDQLNKLGSNVITVRPAGAGTATNYLSAGGAFSGLGASPLNQADWDVVRQTEGVQTAIPLGVGSGFATVEGKKLDASSVIATTDGLPAMLRHKVEFGIFFNEQELNSNVVVIGQRVAEDLFQENAPIGRTLTIRGQDFIVRGVFEGFEGNPLSLGVDLNRAVFIPVPVAASLNNGTLPIAQIFARANDKTSPARASQNITSNLKTAHSGQQDFVVLTRQKDLATSAGSVDLVTQLVIGLAGLSLLVGGIGIANIMLVSVTERTREIGVRKAIGASNRQILNQFLVESATLAGIGGFIGILIALVCIFLIRVSTSLFPVVSWQVVVITPLAAWALGVVFGVAPAIQAARKDPIEALRHE
ncbi:MAG: putative transport system permease protein [Patescibacteria group bacterium]|nr:putative transport system permease protein [Patescibacteria group bacterium]